MVKENRASKPCDTCGGADNARVSCIHLRQDSTPNGFNPGWVELINEALFDRELDTEIVLADLEPWMWDDFIGPMLDRIEDGLEEDEVHTHHCEPCFGDWECSVVGCEEPKMARCPSCTVKEDADDSE